LFHIQGCAVLKSARGVAEFDYEGGPYGSDGIIPAANATAFTVLLAEVKQALGGCRGCQPGKVVSCDIGVWGLSQGSYPMELFTPWVNVSMLNAGAFDFVNTMSYHDGDGSGNIGPYSKDGFVLHELWGIDKQRVNIGVPFFYFNQTTSVKPAYTGEPCWSSLNDLCPDIPPDDNNCSGIIFPGKQMNYNIGAWIYKAGFGGVFPWAANYDTIHNNNSLAAWLNRGMNPELDM
jgi:hypothetical protein